MTKNNNVLIVFAKAPVAGLAKTRLIPKLGAAGAAAFHQKLVLHTLNHLIKPTQWDTQLWCAGDIQHEFFQQGVSRFNLTRHSQQGEDLGQRMYHAMASSLKRYDSVCLVGTDCPVLDEKNITEAFDALKNVELVFNPAEDGGYVLFAAKSIDSRIFENVRWGTHEVMEKTLDNAKKIACQITQLKMLWDVDVPEDLRRLSGITL